VQQQQHHVATTVDFQASFQETLVMLLDSFAVHHTSLLHLH
jgi:hypothetical protein